MVYQIDNMIILADNQKKAENIYKEATGNEPLDVKSIIICDRKYGYINVHATMTPDEYLKSIEYRVTMFCSMIWCKMTPNSYAIECIIPYLSEFTSEQIEEMINNYNIYKRGESPDTILVLYQALKDAGIGVSIPASF